MRTEEIDEGSAIVVDKTRRTLALVADGLVVVSFPVLVGRTPGPKRREGDGRTPEGRYFVLRLLPDEEAVGKGYHKGLHVSYPLPSDAVRGQAERLIDESVRDEIVAAFREGRLPPQESALGGFVAIHGGLSQDETFVRGTQGCVVLRNADMDVVYAFAREGMPVVVHS